MDLEIQGGRAAYIYATSNLSSVGLAEDDWTVYRVCIPPDMGRHFLYQLALWLHRRNEDAPPEQLKAESHNDGTYKWYDLSWRGTNKDRRFVSMCTVVALAGSFSLKELYIIDYSEKQLEYRQLANIARLTGLKELEPFDPFDPQTAKLPIYSIETPNWTENVNEDEEVEAWPEIETPDLQWAALTDFMQTWRKRARHQIFALRPISKQASPTPNAIKSLVTYVACDVYNKHNGCIDARLEFRPDGVYLVDPATQTATDPEANILQKMDYDNPDLNDAIHNAIARIEPSHKELIHDMYRDGAKIKDIKELAEALIRGEVFTSAHCSPEQVPSIFAIIPLLDNENLGALVDFDADFCYEYLSKAGPVGVNGMPMFFSCHFMIRKDGEKVLDIYEKMQEAITAIK